MSTDDQFSEEFDNAVIQTLEGKVFEVTGNIYNRLLLLKNMITLHSSTQTFVFKVPFYKKTIQYIYSFVKIDDSSTSIGEGVFASNPLSISFSEEQFTFIDELSFDQLNILMQASSYLQYHFLLELCAKKIAFQLQCMNTNELLSALSNDSNIEIEIDESSEIV